MENKSKKSIRQLTMGVLSLTAIVIGMWLLILIYLIKFKYIGSTEYPIEKLGQTGDFFNIATSFSGVITVMFVAYGIILQKKELISVQEQIEYQTKKSEEDERVNRTIEILYKWDAPGKESSEINELRINFLKRIAVLYSSNNAFNEKIDFLSIVKILKIEGIYDYFIRLKASKENEILELKKK